MSAIRGVVRGVAAGVELGAGRVGAAAPRSRGRPAIQALRPSGSDPCRGALEPRPGRAAALGREPVAPVDEGSPGGGRRYGGVDAAAVSCPRLPAADPGSGRRLGRLPPPARGRTENRRPVEPVRGADAQAERRAAHVLPLGAGHPNRRRLHRAAAGPSPALAGGPSLSGAGGRVELLVGGRAVVGGADDGVRAQAPAASG